MEAGSVIAADSKLTPPGILKMFAADTFTYSAMAPSTRDP